LDECCLITDTCREILERSVFESLLLNGFDKKISVDCNDFPRFSGLDRTDLVNSFISTFNCWSSRFACWLLLRSRAVFSVMSSSPLFARIWCVRSKRARFSGLLLLLAFTLHFAWECLICTPLKVLVRVLLKFLIRAALKALARILLKFLT